MGATGARRTLGQMPADEPTPAAGDSTPKSPTFRAGAERAADQTDRVPATGATLSPGATGPAGSRPGTGANGGPSAPVTPNGGPGAAAATKGAGKGSRGRSGPSTKRVRARKVRRIVRHIEPWSVLKISVLFYAALFLIICVASALLWGAARSSGTVDNVESFITSVGGFGNCEPIDGEEPDSATTTTVPTDSTAPVDQIDPTGEEPATEATGVEPAEDPGDDEDCREGEELVGEFKFEDQRIFQAFALGGIVLVLAGTAANVVMVLLFNLMSDLTGGVRVTVLEEDPPAARPRNAAGSPGPGRRD